MKHAEMLVMDDGHVACKGDSLMMGYLGDDKLTKQVIRNGILHTALLISYLISILIIYFDYNDTNSLVIGVVVDLGDVPISWEEYEELIGSAVVKASASLVVIVMNHVGTILAIRFACILVDDAETLYTLYYILEVDMLIVALGGALLQRLVIAIFYTYYEVGTWDRVLVLGDGEKVSLGKKIEEGFPLLWVLLILQVEVYEIHTAVGISLLEAIAPFAFLVPFLCSLHQFWLVAIVLGIDSFLAALGASRCARGECHSE